MTTAISAISQHWLQKKYDTLMASIFVHRKEKRVEEKETLHNLVCKVISLIVQENKRTQLIYTDSFGDPRMEQYTKLVYKVFTQRNPRRKKYIELLNVFFSNLLVELKELNILPPLH